MQLKINFFHFKIFSDEILYEWQVKCCGIDLDIDITSLRTLLFADDQIDKTGEDYDAEYMLRKLIEIY